MMLGADPGNRGQPEHFFSGTIAGFHVTNGVHYYQDFTPNYPLLRCDDSLMLYVFNEGKGRSVFDSSGNKHPATLEDIEWIALTEPPSWKEVPAEAAVLDISNANEPWAREWKVVATRSGGDSKGFRETIDRSSTRGAKGVLGIHPVADAQPARIARHGHLDSQDRVLRVNVTGSDDGDFALLVKANGIPLHKAQSISGKKGWQELIFYLTAFTRQDVQLEIEVHNTGWWYEHAFFDDIRISSR